MVQCCSTCMYKADIKEFNLSSETTAKGKEMPGYACDVEGDIAYMHNIPPDNYRCELYAPIYDNNGEIRVTKLPSFLDPNRMIKQEIDRKYRDCPFCKSHKSTRVYMRKQMHGKGKDKKISELWEVDRYHCADCDAEWETDPYPIAIEIPLGKKAWAL